MIVVYKKTAQRFVYSFIVSLLFLQASAQNHVYSLQELADSAIKKYPEVMRKQALVNSATAGITDAKHEALPFVKAHDQLNISTANGVPGTFMPMGIILPTAGGIRADNNYQAATGNIGMLYSEYELYNFGLTKARIEDAVAKQKLSVADVTKESYLLSYNIAKYYLELLRVYEQSNIELQNMKRYQALVTVIQAETNSGLKPGVDSSQALAELAKARINYNQRIGEAMQLEQQLFGLTGVKVSMENVDTSLNRFNQLVKDAVAINLVDTVNNPLISYYQQRRQAEISTANFIKKSYQPKITLAAGLWGRASSLDYTDTYNALSTGLGYQRFNYLAGIAFTYNLFDGIHRRDKLAVQKYKIRASEYEVEQQQLNLQTSLQQSFSRQQVAERNLIALPVELKSASDTYDQKMAQYKAGLINLIDLTNAAFVLYRSQGDYVQTLTDWVQSRLDQAAVAGSLNSFIQTLK
ncbi:MAG: TolC family protein [Bacteroidota bacterium]|nr:TolC family protein [Bacteroidota bacterium]